MDQHVILTGQEGTSKIELDLNKMYKISIRKIGYVTKDLSINTECSYGGDWGILIPVDMIKECPNLKYDPINKDFVNIFFDKERREFSRDKIYEESVKKEFNDLKVIHENCINRLNSN